MEEECLKDRGRLSLLALKHNSLFISGECLVCTVGCRKDRNHDTIFFFITSGDKIQEPNKCAKSKL